MGWGGVGTDKLATGQLVIGKLTICCFMATVIRGNIAADGKFATANRGDIAAVRGPSGC